MFLLAAMAFPILLMGLLLAMERVERPLSAAEVTGELEGFLDGANSDEVDTFVSQGFAAALERYRRRRRPGRHRAA
jgi:hypothetical protein